MDYSNKNYRNNMPHYDSMPFSTVKKRTDKMISASKNNKDNSFKNLLEKLPKISSSTEELLKNSHNSTKNLYQNIDGDKVALPRNNVDTTKSAYNPFIPDYLAPNSNDIDTKNLPQELVKNILNAQKDSNTVMPNMKNIGNSVNDGNSNHKFNKEMPPIQKNMSSISTSNMSTSPYSSYDSNVYPTDSAIPATITCQQLLELLQRLNCVENITNNPQ